MIKILLLAALVTLVAPRTSSGMTEDRADPRNVGSYRVLFDLGAEGESDLVNGFGGYIQVYVPGDFTIFRFCTNFEGKGTDGRPNPARERMKFVPIDSNDSGAYICKNYSSGAAKNEVPLIQLGKKTFFAMTAPDWTEKSGGEVHFKFARKLPLIGSPTYKSLHLRVRRTGEALAYSVELLVPKGETLAARYLHFMTSTSGLGIPNGITRLVLNPGEGAGREINIDGLEAPAKRISR